MLLQRDEGHPVPNIPDGASPKTKHAFDWSLVNYCIMAFPWGRNWATYDGWDSGKRIQCVGRSTSSQLRGEPAASANSPIIHSPHSGEYTNIGSSGVGGAPTGNATGRLSKTPGNSTLISRACAIEFIWNRVRTGTKFQHRRPESIPDVVGLLPMPSCAGHRHTFNKSRITFVPIA
jgi:hypothetical protein